MQSITSDELGRLMFLRVRNQNSVVVNLPSAGVARLRADAQHRVRRDESRRSRSTRKASTCRAAGATATALRRHAVHPAGAELVVQQSQPLVSAGPGHRLRDRDDPVHACRADHTVVASGVHAVGIADPRAAAARSPPRADVRLTSRRSRSVISASSSASSTASMRATVALDIVQPQPDYQRLPTNSALVPSIGAAQHRRPRGRGQSATAGAWPRYRRHGGGDSAALCGDGRRRAVRRDDDRDGRARAARRPQSGLLRRAQQSAAGDAVRVSQRPGVVHQLPRVLRRARARASVVGPGRRLEELSRAVAERGLRAVLRRALRARNGAASRHSATCCGSSGAGRWISPIKARCISAIASATSRATAASSARWSTTRAPRSCTCCGAWSATTCSSAGCGATTRRIATRRPAPKTCSARWKPSRADRSIASSSAGSSRPAFRACVTPPLSKGRRWSCASSRSARSTTCRSR